MKIKNWLKNKIHKFVAWVRKDKWRTAGTIFWIYLFVRYQGIRDFFLGVLKFIFGMWATMIGFVVAMMIFAILAFVVMGIMVKMGILPEDYLSKALAKAHKERVEREEKEQAQKGEQV